MQTQYTYNVAVRIATRARLSQRQRTNDKLNFYSLNRQCTKKKKAQQVRNESIHKSTYVSIKLFHPPPPPPMVNNGIYEGETPRMEIKPDLIDSPRSKPTARPAPASITLINISTRQSRRCVSRW